MGATWDTMTAKTKKVGIAGKWGTRYGASIRKQAKKIEILQRSKYICPFCSVQNIKRKSNGVWKCKSCEKTMAGGCWTLSTTAAVTAKGTIARLRKSEQAE